MSQKFTDPRVLGRFIKYMAVATFVMFSVWAVLTMIKEEVPGDFEVRQGDIFLQDKKFTKAIERFEEALQLQPDHRGALGGRAVGLIALERYDEAEEALIYLIDFLTRSLGPDDPTGVGALSAAYINRAIIKDRQGRYEEALTDYVEAIKIDYDLAEGPGWIDHILYYDKKPSSALARAKHIYKQLQLPEGERLMRIPELDAKQRIYKP